VDGQFMSGIFQTPALGLQAGAGGALCRGRPALHPGGLSQHVHEPGRQGGGLRVTMETCMCSTQGGTVTGFLGGNFGPH